MIKVKYFIVTIIFVSNISLAENTNLRKNDAALIAHIKKTDHIFTSALGKCNSEKIHRKISSDEKSFEYIGVCVAKVAQGGDCPEYKVKATGTVDTDSWATLREIKLELQCYG